MKKILKKVGKFFIALSQKDMPQSILLIDSSFILPNNFALIIKNVKEKFKNAKLVVLTSFDKKEFIKDNFPDVEIIVPSDRIRSGKFQLAIQLFLLLRRNFNFIILSSLDISLALISLIFVRCPIFLHNRWLEWYRLRQRTVLDILRGTRSIDKNRRVINKGIKDVIKSLGRIFVILSKVRDEDIKSRILIEDNGYTEVGHVITAVRRAEEFFINPDITILTFTMRKQDFINSFPQMKLVIVGENGNRNSLAVQMYRMRKDKFNYLVLTALDIIPILISFLFFRVEVLLYNRWHQWWSLELRNIWGYLKEILIFLVNIPVLIYLFITACFILLRTRFRLVSANIKSIVAKKR
jgi:hypothetical protein